LPNQADKLLKTHKQKIKNRDCIIELKTHKQKKCIIASPKRPQNRASLQQQFKTQFFLGKKQRLNLIC
jgi:hypothetical protein